MANIDHKLPFFGSAILGAISFLIFIIFMPNENKLRNKQIETSSDHTKTPKNNFWSLALVMLLTMILVSSFGLAAFENMFSLYFHDVRGFNLNEIAVFLIVNGILSLIFQVVFFDKLVRFMGELMIIRLSFLFGFISIIWILFSQQKWEVFIATLIVFVGFDILRPAITTLLSHISDSQQGFVNGLNMSLTSVGNIFGPILGGILLDLNSNLPYTFVAIVLALATFLTFTIRFNTIHS